MGTLKEQFMLGDYTFIRRIMRFVLEALIHEDVKDTVLAMDEVTMRNIGVSFRLSLQQAGFYDGSRDGVGMLIGEGFIRHDGLDHEVDQVKIHFPLLTCLHCDGKGIKEISGHDLPIICPVCRGGGLVFDR